MNTPEITALAELLDAVEQLSASMAEATDLVGTFPTDLESFSKLNVVQRTASAAFLKRFEQLQDLVARALRVILMLEDEDLTGFTARAIADRAESVGLIESSDRWAKLVKLRNRLAHEYPLSPAAQFKRLEEAWSAQFALLAITATIDTFLAERGYLNSRGEVDLSND